MTVTTFLRGRPAFPKGAFSLATLLFDTKALEKKSSGHVAFSILGVYIERGGGGQARKRRSVTAGYKIVNKVGGGPVGT